VIGLDGADWSLLDRLASEGKMPNWARLVREGRSARLRSFVPILSPVVWSTIATGAAPDVHGVLDFQEVDPATGAVVPISGRSRKVPAVWNLASASGLRVGVVGWWASHPPEEVNGFFVSDRASSILFESRAAATAFPPSLNEAVARTLDREETIADGELTRFFPMSSAEIAAKISEGGDLANPIIGFKKTLAATRASHRLARDLYDRERPELLALYLEGTDAVGHVLGQFVPPRLSCVSEEDFRRYGGAVEAYYGVIDQLLGQWMRRAEEDRGTVLVCSDHGFKWGEDRSCQRSSLNWNTAAFWHRLEGVLAVWGARVEPAPSRSEASVYDITPTVCALLGIPTDRRMAGTALLSLFQGVMKPKSSDVFSRVSVRRLPESPPAAGEVAEYAKKLRALGYLSGSESKAVTVPPGDRPGVTEGGWNNLGLYQREAGRLDDAERSFREALRRKPDYASPMFNLAVLERTRGRWTSALEWLFRSLDAGHPEPEETILQWLAFAVDTHRRPVALSLLEAAVHRYPKSENLALQLARLRFEDRNCRGAVSALQTFAQAGGRDTLNLLGLSELCLGHSVDARRYLERSLALDPGQTPIREALRRMQTMM
jgi:Tfp pilus assembly protein PilF